MSKYVTAVPTSGGMCRVTVHNRWIYYNQNDAACEKLRISLYRTRHTIEQLLYCNDFPLFVTATLPNDAQGNPPSREDVENRARNAMRTLRRANDAPIRYVLVPELSERNRWHLHGVLGGVSMNLLHPNDLLHPCPMENKPKIAVQCYDIPPLSAKYGYYVAEDIVQSAELCGLDYLVAYLCKTMYVDKYPLENYKHRSIVSRGLRRPQPIYSGGITDSEYVRLRQMAQDRQTGSAIDSVLLLLRQDVEAFFRK